MNNKQIEKSCDEIIKEFKKQHPKMDTFDFQLEYDEVEVILNGFYSIEDLRALFATMEEIKKLKKN
jgi:predicted aldo/keto reductase-like oxidoreductase